jgi:hypothetical protein
MIRSTMSAAASDRQNTIGCAETSGDPMTVADYSIAAFVFLNGARVLAYAPQIWCLMRDNGNAAAVSLMTWTLFTLANFATVAYASLVANDPLLAGIFAMNSLGCLTIVVMIAKKRIYSSMRPSGTSGASPETLLERLLSAWRHRTQRRLELHLRLLLPAKGVKLLDESAHPLNERHGVRE